MTRHLRLQQSRQIHWLHYEYKKTNPNAKYDKLFKRILPKFDKIIAVSEGVEQAFNKIYHLENKTSIIPNLVNTDKIIKKSKEKEVSKIRVIAGKKGFKIKKNQNNRYDVLNKETKEIEFENLTFMELKKKFINKKVENCR